MLNQQDKKLLDELKIVIPFIGVPEGWIKIDEIKIPFSKYRNISYRFLETPEGDLKELEDSIKKEGLKNKIILNNKFELIDGFLRIKAFQLLGYSIIPYSISKDI